MTAGIPFGALLILCGTTCFLPGQWHGLQHFFWPKEGWYGIFLAFVDPKVWFNAITQSLFSMSIGSGTLPKMGSENKFRHNILRDSLIVVGFDTLMSLLAGRKII